MVVGCTLDVLQSAFSLRPGVEAATAPGWEQRVCEQGILGEMVRGAGRRELGGIHRSRLAGGTGTAHFPRLCQARGTPACCLPFLPSKT